MITADVADLRALTGLLGSDEYSTRLTVDTNTLIDNPDLAAHVPTLGRRYMVHLLPVVLREIDDLKRAGKTPGPSTGSPPCRPPAEGTAQQRRHPVRCPRGRRGPRRVRAHRAEGDRLPSWLDLTVPDDRFVASSLLVQSDYPGSALYVATSDINLQTRLSAVGLPFVELPAS